jgi:hypothetical protein
MVVAMGGGERGKSEVTLMVDDGPEAGAVLAWKNCLEVGRD